MIVRKSLILAAALAATATSVPAQSASPQGAQPSAAPARAGAPTSDTNRLSGSTGWFYLVVLLAALIAGGLVLSKDNDRASP